MLERGIPRHDYEIHSNNINIDADILRGKATSRMSSQSLAHLFIVLFIILGNLSYYYIKRNQEFYY